MTTIATIFCHIISYSDKENQQTVSIKISSKNYDELCNGSKKSMVLTDPFFIIFTETSYLKVPQLQVTK